MGDDVWHYVWDSFQFGQFAAPISDTPMVLIPKMTIQTISKTSVQSVFVTCFIRLLPGCWSIGYIPFWMTWLTLSKVVLYLVGVLLIMPSSSKRTSITWRNPKGRKVIWSSSLILRKLMTKCIGTSCVKLFRFLDSLMVSFLLLCMVFPRPLFLYYGTGVLPLILNQKRVLRGTCSPLPVCSLHRKAWCYDHVSNARASGPKVSHLFFADDVLLFTK